MTRVIWGWVTTSAVVLAATAVQAQTFAADEIRPPYSEIRPPYAAQDQVVVGRGPYAALPVPGDYGGYEEVVPPYQAARVLRAMGYELIGAPVRRRWVYMVPVINAEGMEGRALLDVHTGRILRFVPAAYGEEEAVGAYGPPGPPPMPAPERMNARTSLRPPASVPPHLASRTPPKPEAQPAAAAPQPQPAAPVQQQAAAAPPRPTPVAPKPAVALQPTQPMPPVQGLE